MRRLIIIILSLSTILPVIAQIDRKVVLQRHNPHLTAIDTLASLSVGNGEFAFTCDVTGLQTFHRLYRHGVPLGTMAQWGWHSFPNTEHYTPQEVLKPFDFRRGQDEWYSCQFKSGREKAASDYLRSNPHRLHLGIIAFDGITPDAVSDIDQTLRLYDGTIESSYLCEGQRMKVITTCDAQRDMVVARINDKSHHPVSLHFPYPTGAHSDDACNWTDSTHHSVSVISVDDHQLIACHTLDGQSYYVRLEWQGGAHPLLVGSSIRITPASDSWMLAVEYLPQCPSSSVRQSVIFDRSIACTTSYWHDYWDRGGIVDMSHCTDPRAFELERRIVLSQYLLAIQCAGSTPPQETGLTYNSWFGKFHLEMIWWHQAHFPLWGHADMLLRTLPWYHKAHDMARTIAERQGMEGVRWMKMTDPSAAEAPSNVGSFLIWQQPHLIYLLELAYRASHDYNIIKEYGALVQQTATFMASFATYDAEHDRYTLRGCIPAQETLKAAETVNPPFELSYWHFALLLAQQWRERQGLPRHADWDRIISHLSSLCAKDSVYAAAETADSYTSLTSSSSSTPSTPSTLSTPSPSSTLSTPSPSSTSSTPSTLTSPLNSDHMAVLAALGVLPHSPQIDRQIMGNTLRWVMNHWNWNKTWGWDYPTTCMCATRLLDPDTAIDALLMDVRTNTYLPNGHNYQDDRLRCYLPGNGGLLTAVALMCAGWDGCTTPLPGFPKDGKWDVRYEGILPLP